jgi:hypothetical protein
MSSAPSAMTAVRPGRGRRMLLRLAIAIGFNVV